MLAGHAFDGAGTAIGRAVPVNGRLVKRATAAFALTPDHGLIARLIAPHGRMSQPAGALPGVFVGRDGTDAVECPDKHAMSGMKGKGTMKKDFAGQVRPHDVERRKFL